MTSLEHLKNNSIDSLRAVSLVEETTEFDSRILSTEISSPEETLSSTGFAISAVCLFFIFIIGCFNNIVVIVAVSGNKKLRTPMNLILLNLSVSDFTISLFGTPLSFVSALYHRWVFGDLLCQVYAFMMTLTGMTAIGTLSAIAIERYIIISRPFHSAGLTPTTAGVVIFYVWAYALSQALPPLFGWNQYVVENPGIACSLNWQSSSVLDSSYIFFIFSVGYVIPLLIMIVCYGRVISIIKKSPRLTGKSSTAKAEYHVTLMACAMIICTMVAWTPYAVVSLIVALGYAHLMGPVSSVCPAIFAKTSVIYNPIVYFFLNSQIRDVILSNFRPCFFCCKQTAVSEEFSLETRPGCTVVNDTVISIRPEYQSEPEKCCRRKTEPSNDQQTVPSNDHQPEPSNSQQPEPPNDQQPVQSNDQQLEHSNDQKLETSNDQQSGPPNERTSSEEKLSKNPDSNK